MPQKQRLLITGITGMLGKDIADVFSTGFEVFGVARKAPAFPLKAKVKLGNLTDPDFVDQTLASIQPDIIIHTAAIANVDACEKDRQAAYDLHVKSTEQLAKYLKAKFIYISTDAVFDGRTGNYTEGDKTNPLNYYSKTKLQGEEAAQSANPKTMVIRTNIFGFHIPLGKSLAEWAITNLVDGKDINGFADVRFNPVYTKHLAKTIFKLSDTNFSGIINVVSGDTLSKYEFLKRLADSLGLPSQLIHKSSLNDANLTAARSHNSFLSNHKLKSLFNIELSTRQGLADYIKDFKPILAHLKGTRYTNN